jgi:peptidoglycan/xylan/chitin deacetylase (PgdA/CDA1 family)
MEYGAFYRVRTSKREIALTFDDGPDAGVTPAMLAMLARHGVHATFFVVGRRALALPGIVAAELAAGDEIGNHTYDHALMLRLGDDAAAREILLCDTVLRGIGVRHSSWFRPPYGEASDGAYQEARVSGLRMVLWTVALDRLARGAGIAAAARALASRVAPGDIVLAHDCCPPYDRMRTVVILDRALAILQARGYRIVTVSRLVADGTV